MPLVVNPTPPQPRRDTEPKIVSNHYGSNLLDSKEWSTISITTQMDGSPWELKAYYQQVLGPSQSSSAPNFDAPDVYQQYRELLDFEVMVTSALSSVQNTETSEFEVRGEANLYPGIIPVQGDVLVAGAPDGRLAYFVVTEVQRLTIYNNSAYTLQYVQKGFYDSSVANFFNERTVEVLHYRKDYLRSGRYPFLTTDEFVSSGNIRDIRSQLVDRMNRKFYDPRVYCFPVPSQSVITYDPFLTESWRDLVQYLRDYQERRYTVHNVKGSTVDRALTVWDVLLKRADWVPDLITSKVLAAPTYAMTKKPSLYTVRNTIFDAVLVPTDQFSFPGANQTLTALAGDFIDPWGTDCECEEPPEVPEPPYPSDDPPLTNPIGKDGTYIFSQAFYSGHVPEMSVIEREAWKAIHNEPMDLPNLFRINEGLPAMNPLEQYYCTAVLYCLLALYEWR